MLILSVVVLLGLLIKAAPHEFNNATTHCKRK